MSFENEKELDNLDTDCDKEFDDEKFESPEELEKRKREINNRFSAKDNVAQNQIFIQDAGAGGLTVNYYGQKTVPVNPILPVEKRYDLRKTEECIEFVETFKSSEYFTTAIILCVLEAVRLADMADLKLKIEPYLPIERVYDSGDMELQLIKKNPYVAIDSVLAVIGGNKFVMEDGYPCVSIGENFALALENLLEQFPVLGNVVAELLIQITQEDRYHTRFYEHQIANVLVKMRAAKRNDLEKRIFSELYNNYDNVYLLGIYMYKLSQENEIEAKSIMLQWFRSDSTWIWSVMCLVYVLFQENDICFPFEERLITLLVKHFFSFRRKDFEFISLLLLQSRALRTLMCNAFNSAYSKARTTIEKKYIVQFYISLIRRSYYKVNAKCVELPLVACDTRQQQEWLADILGKIMAEYHLRRQLYMILQVYMKEISNYEVSKTVYQHIAAYCYNMASADSVYLEDVRALLRNCDNKAANQVLGYLENK